MTPPERIDPLGLDPPPGWLEAAPPDAASIRERFAAVAPYTVGIEEELMLLDPVSLDVAPLIDRAIAATGNDPRYKPELPAGQIEIVTPVCRTVAEATTQVARARTDLVAALAGEARLFAAGTHPFARMPLQITDGERYAAIAREYQWAAPRGLCCGLHVHVAVADADRALAVVNAVRSYLPLLAALAANGPYLEGVDTGLATVRPKLCEGFPRQGVPPSFATLEDLVAYLAWGRSSGSFPQASHVWHEVRLHPVHGTVEIRVPDMQTRVEDTAALAAVVHALVVELSERHIRGEQLATHRRERIDENRWRALRHGIHGHLADLESGAEMATREVLRHLLDELEPTAAMLGCEAEHTHARTLLVGNGADRQRAVHAAEGMHGLARWIAEETESAFAASAPAAPPARAAT